ncbi:hypothetical protein B7P43_G14041 [Cryptotermes secundus]|uniref:Uncharacterized protein n=1 Tax=Cryptotermes secundus TaxID=105785 RepID=A0A2J7PFW1_9NEOP|nr:hypothetical protein B7P43_G14041 [Cryptotermes secundus]
MVPVTATDTLSETQETVPRDEGTCGKSSEGKKERGCPRPVKKINDIWPFNTATFVMTYFRMREGSLINFHGRPQYFRLCIVSYFVIV